MCQDRLALISVRSVLVIEVVNGSNYTEVQMSILRVNDGPTLMDTMHYAE